MQVIVGLLGLLLETAITLPTSLTSNRLPGPVILAKG